MFSQFPASETDFDRLFQLRLVTMRESLERIGRYDEQRAYRRFRDSFRPRYTQLILDRSGALVGCVALGPGDGGLVLEHFYIAPDHQGRGLGGAVLAHLMAQAHEADMAIVLGVLRESRAGSFYARHGFRETGGGEWDIYYRRLPRPRSFPSTNRAIADG